MVRYLKEGISQEEKDDAEVKVRKTVESILDDIKVRGDAALKDYSEKFDNWRPGEFWPGN
jgi:sulfopropanediol 3-dehydrogenase